MQKYYKFTNLISLVLIVALGFLLRVHNIGYPLMKVFTEAKHTIVANNTIKYFEKFTLYDDPSDTS